MIKLQPTSLDHVYVTFEDETVFGVTYHGSYHCNLYDGKTWEGNRPETNPPRKAFDYPLNSYTALHARRTGSNGEVSSAARKALSTRCRDAVLVALQERPQEFVQAQSTALLEAHRSKLDALKEAETELSKARREEREAWEAFDAYRTKAGLPSEDRKRAS